PVLGKLPEIGELKKLLLESGAKAALMSGSGSTVFGVFDSEEDAKNALESIHLPDGIWSATVSTITS
ncbi:4-(cytidine 5'-diphospho)-2-C-methyl-D-erythritol kinase, partial [Nitrospirota bacterium]